MSLTFLAPAWLWLLPVAALVWFVPRRADDSRHAWLRTITLALVVLALAQPTWLRESAAPHHVLVLDGDAVAEETVADWRGRQEGETTVVRADDSDLTRGLAVAGGEIPDGTPGSITLVTDGLATRRDWGAVTSALTARGVPIHAVPLSADTGAARLAGLRATGPLRVGHTAELELVVADAREPFDVTLLDGTTELAVLREVPPGPRVVVPLRFEPARAGYATLTARLDAEESIELAVAIQDPLRVAFLGERVARSRDELAALLGPGFELDAADPTSTDLADADVVWIDDVPAASLDTAVQSEWVRAVTDQGVGLLMSGGTGSFGPGGYHDTPLGDALPVDCVQQEEKRDPSTTLCVIIDTSGSMGGQRVQLAKEVARLAIRRLLPHDKVGIVEFFGAKRWAAPIQPASNAIELQRALNRLNAGGGTVILPAIEEAFYGMQNVQTRYKHVLVLTDGGVESGSFEPLIRKMADEGMNVSTVLIGPASHSEFLVSIANWGKGRFYAVPNRFNLPELILKQPTTARLPGYKPGDYGVEGLGGPGWWGDVDASRLPRLSGYVETRARDDAEVLLRVAETGHPVLATWVHGVGRVTALTTEPVGPGTDRWQDWHDYGALLGRVLARTAADPESDFAYRTHRDRHGVTLFATRQSAVPAGRVPTATAEVVQDGASPTAVQFHEVADGHFEARIAVGTGREVRIEAGTSERPFRLVSGSGDGVAREEQVDPARALDLVRLSEATGGVRVDADELSTFRAPAGGEGRPHSAGALWPLCLLAALLGYLADLFHRRTDRVATPGGAP